jgi:hypothetical protein
MNITTITDDPIACDEVNGTLSLMLDKQGFNTPIGLQHAASVAYDLHEHQFPLIERDGEIAFIFEVPDWQMSERLAAAWTLISAKRLGIGQPFGMIEEGHDPDLWPLMKVQPKPGAPANSNASVDEFRFHCDNAILPKRLRPEWISLACMNNEAEAATGIVSVEAISDALHPVYRQAVREDRFVCEAPPSFGEGYAESEPRPIIFDTLEGVQAAFPTYRTSPADKTDKVASDALREAERLANEMAQWITLKPGQILIFNNEQAMHARKPINGNRLLLRAYWRQDTRELDRQAGTAFAHLYSAKRALAATRGVK